MLGVLANLKVQVTFAVQHRHVATRFVNEDCEVGQKLGQATQVLREPVKSVVAGVNLLHKEFLEWVDEVASAHKVRNHLVNRLQGALEDAMQQRI